ncbi:MAG: bifunctional YncE family protein/alkaline phosphatase family protein [Bryobacteraceae bacterium]|jgi:YVTN family beta-propeller protein
MKTAVVVLPIALTLALSAQPAGWRLRPAGRQVALGALPMSSAVSPDGRYLLVLNGGAAAPSISVIETATERVAGSISVPDAWLGLTFSRQGDRVYAGGGSRAAVLEFGFAEGRLIARRTFPVTPPEKRTGNDFTGDVTFDPAGRLLYAADLFNNSIVVINPQSGVVIERFPTGRRPYRILFPPDGKTFLVSSWADGSVYHHETATGAVLEKLRLGAHPTDMLWAPGKPVVEEESQLEWVAARLFVAAANTNNVYVLGASESGELRQIDTINVSLTPWQPAGMTPSALALSPDRKRLFVVCSDANAVAVEGITGARAEQLGFLPTGGYPTAIQALRDNRVVVLNGRGLGSLQTGTASFIDPPSDEALADYSKTVLDNTPYRDALLEDAGTGKDSPIPAQPGQASPIRHMIYIVGENHQDGANRRKLAREFVRLENFRADGEQWATAGIASDFVEKMRPRPFDYEGGEPAATPASGYLWTNAAAAGISMRNYGHFVVNRPLQEVAGGIQVQLVKDPVLNRVTNLRYRGADPDYPDMERAKVFLEDLADFEKTGQMPALILMRLEEDIALGRIVEAVSKSRFWTSTAIFVSPALAISPYVKRGAVDGTLYNTASMLRTVELLLGLRPMTVFDAGARPLSSCFQTTADPRPYTAEGPHR